MKSISCVQEQNMWSSLIKIEIFSDNLSFVVGVKVFASHSFLFSVTIK